MGYAKHWRNAAMRIPEEDGNAFAHGDRREEHCEERHHVSEGNIYVLVLHQAQHDPVEAYEAARFREPRLLSE
jgi:hypothetical protein